MSAVIAWIFTFLCHTKKQSKKLFMIIEKLFIISKYCLVHNHESAQTKKTGKYSRKYDSIIFLKIRIWMHLRNHKLNLNFYLVLKIIFILLVMDLKFEFFVWNNSLKIALHFEQNKSNVDFYIDKGFLCSRQNMTFWDYFVFVFSSTQSPRD